MLREGIAICGLMGLVAPACAQDTSAPDTTDEIIVTAQKRSQSLQDVSASITAVTGSALRDSGVSGIEGLQTSVPNITIGDSFGFANLFIRGLGLNSTFANVDPSVTVYEDGAIISHPAAQLFSFFDLERIEVLRGPQGSLYGRNATGGTINLITARPTFEEEGFVRVRAGTRGTFETEAAFSTPVADQVAVRLSAFSTSHEGFGRNSVTGNRVGNASTWAVRGQLRFEPSPDWDIGLAGEYGREDDAGNALYFKRETFPGVLTDGNPANDGLAATGIGGYNTSDPRGYASDYDPSNHRETWSASNKTVWRATDQITLTNILAYRRFKSRQIQDLDLSAVVNSSIQEFNFDSRHFSEEFQVGLDLGKLNVVGGFFYFTEKLDHLNAIGRSPRSDIYNPSAPGGGRRVYLLGKGKTDTWALFWNATYALTDHISLKGGGRYTQDKRLVDNEGYVFAGPATATQRYFPGPDGERTFRDYTNEAGLEWRPARDIMAYYTYSEGFKAGTGQLGTTAGGIVDPETIVNHEIGLKSSLDGNRLTFNVSAYAYKIKGLQLDQTLPGGPTGFITQFKNATTQTSQGVEVDATWRPSRSFRTNLSFAYQHTEFGSFFSVNPANPAQTPEDIAGNRARNAPEWVGALHVEYGVPLANGAKLTFAGDGSYKSRMYFTEFNESWMSQGPYALVDAQLRYDFPGDRLQVSMWGKNLTDNLVEAANFAVATGRVTGRTFLPPRTIGVSANYRF
jgi:iron complex outermembrane receptor protein